MSDYADARRELQTESGLRVRVIDSLSRKEEKGPARESGFSDWLRGGRAEYAKKERKAASEARMKAEEEQLKAKLYLQQAEKATRATKKVEQAAIELDNHYNKQDTIWRSM